MRMLMIRVALAAGFAWVLSGCSHAPRPPDAMDLSSPAVATLSQQALLERQAAGDDSLLLIDVRSPEEFAAGHVPGAINIPHADIGARLQQLRAAGDKDIVLYCESGRRAGLATQTLQSNGFERVLHLEGHMQQWRARSQSEQR